MDSVIDQVCAQHVISGGARITYAYDEQGKPARRENAGFGVSVTRYVDGTYEYNTYNGCSTSYYRAFDRRIAVRNSCGNTLDFILADQLGSTSTVLSAAGAVEESQKYYPFGAPRWGGITLTDKPARRGGKFTGQQQEPAMWGEMFGLYNYGAREYCRTFSGFPLRSNTPAFDNAAHG